MARIHELNLSRRELDLFKELGRDAYYLPTPISILDEGYAEKLERLGLVRLHGNSTLFGGGFTEGELTDKGRDLFKDLIRS